MDVAMSHLQSPAYSRYCPPQGIASSLYPCPKHVFQHLLRILHHLSLLQSLPSLEKHSIQLGYPAEKPYRCALNTRQALNR